MHLLKLRTGVAAICALGAAIVLQNSHADAPQAPNFAGAWRLDDRNSDTADTVTTLLRSEARKEQSPHVQPAPATSSATSNDHPQGGGRHGGGGGMGHGGGGGMGGGGGGHGQHGGGKHADSTNSSDTATGLSDEYPLPPLLKIDSVLLVQQDQKSFQVQLNNGELLDTRLDGQTRPALNGSGMASAHLGPDGISISIQFADGSVLRENWVRSPDGHGLTVSGQWKVPALQEPISFKRSYISLH